MESKSNQFFTFLQNSDVEITEMTSKDTETHRQEWFKRIVPAEKQQKAIDCHCFDNNGYSGYLWHVFSYEILDYIGGDEARSAFDSVSKREIILLANWNDIASCRIKNASNITAELIERLDDVILTDCNFEWTYAKTHELSCGPYFHRIRAD